MPERIRASGQPIVTLSKESLVLKMLRNEIVRNVLTLMTGATVSQAIPIAAMPVLTRIYSPQEFGVFALFVAISTILSVAATARYDLAIMLPASDVDAASIVVLSGSISLAFAVLLGFVVWLAEGFLVGLTGNPEIGPWLYFLPVTVALMGAYQSLSYWTTRQKFFRRLAVSRVSESGATSLAQIAMHGVSSSGGLIFGTILGKITSFSLLLSMSWKGDSQAFRQVSVARVIENARRFKKFPKYALAGDLLDTIAAQLPTLMISRFFGSEAAGHFNLSFRVLCLPITFVSGALSQVLHQKVVEIDTNDPTKLRGFIVRVFLLLLLSASPFVPLMWLVGESLFGFVFGEPWRSAGSLAGYLSIVVVVRFAVSPLSVVMALERNLIRAVLWQSLYFVTIFLVLFNFRSADIKVFVLAFVVSEVLLYSIFFVLILSGTRSGRSAATDGGGASGGN